MSHAFKPTLRWLPGRKPTIFSANFTPQHRLSNTTQAVIKDAAHPHHFILTRKYAKKDRNGLWWSPQVTLAVSPKRTVRSWCARRLRAAFKEELAARGLNELGQKVQDGKTVAGPAAFRGTLMMHTNANLITAKYKKVREEAGWVADALLAAFTPAATAAPTGGKPQMLRPGGKGRETAGKGRAPRGQQ